ncbi:trypsin-like peptidase domain-containing protein [Devosia sp. Root635]|uniref:trypsin-like peptidase domain-containing protein n=1 Tax=Devosia sp. Root635 TaxID=1736575 RepID=UPI0006FC446C|nr:trypsin-like peptidase domain-containing protein [Devosia sp. Root635]KRA52994.1 hypothetical protein ASD80_14440 [Devosia sp. Root635]
MADHFLTKSQVNLAQCLPFASGLALDSHAALKSLLRSRVSESAASLFAEPLVSRGNDIAEPSISWYTDMPGEGRLLSELEEQDRARIDAILSSELRAMRGLLADPEDGALMAAALHLANSPRGDIWVVDGRPVIINWGMLPEGGGLDQESRTAQFGATLGRYLPLSAAPPLNEAERRARIDLVGGAEPKSAAPETPAPQTAPVAPPPAAVIAAAAPVASVAPTVVREQTEPRRGVPIIAWLPLLILLLISAGLLIWLLLPNSRIFPAYDADRAIETEAAAGLARSVNDALRERLADLRDARDGAMCRADGTLVLPDGMTVDGLLPLDPVNPADAPGMAAPASATPILPPDPGRVQVPQSAPTTDGAGDAGETGDVSLLEMIESRTVMVIADGADSLGTGSGFFIAPDLVVTNHHVVESAAEGGLFVTNRALGRLHPAQLVKAAGPFEAVGADFALLRVPGVQSSYFGLLDADSSLKLQSVVAAGYPGDVLETDNAFQSLREGNSGAVPDLTVTDGTINAEQSLTDYTHAVVHSAPISRGNSGGPLIDMCGRVVGVNTFVRQGDLRNLNFALSIRDLVAFLGDTGAAPVVETHACEPRLLRPAAPASEPDDAAATAPAEADAQAAPAEDAAPAAPEAAQGGIPNFGLNSPSGS